MYPNSPAVTFEALDWAIPPGQSERLLGVGAQHFEYWRLRMPRTGPNTQVLAKPAAGTRRA